jgi:GDPmannose 4,6-dehydratase
MCRLAFEHAGLDWQRYVNTHDALLRPAEVDALCGDATNTRERLGWRPQVALAQLMGKMVDTDLARYAGVAEKPR